jgi:outer membrane immunogenic protein
MKTAIAAAALAAASLVALAAAPASAQDNLPYYGSLGYSQTDSNTGNLGAVTGRLGWKSSTFIGVEGEASFGVDDTLVSPGVTAEIDNQFAGYVTGTWSPDPAFDIIGRVGYGTTRIKTTVGSVNEDSVNYGVGAQWNFAGPNALRVDWTRFDFRDSTAGEADTWTASYVRKF